VAIFLSSKTRRVERQGAVESVLPSSSPPSHSHSPRLSNPEKRNTAYKVSTVELDPALSALARQGHDALAIYDPDVEIVPAEVQKSTAFDATELPGESLLWSFLTRDRCHHDAARLCSRA
jgi:hypothetical protein